MPISAQHVYEVPVPPGPGELPPLPTGPGQPGTIQPTSPQQGGILPETGMDLLGAAILLAVLIVVAIAFAVAASRHEKE